MLVTAPDPNDPVLRQAFTDSELLTAVLEHIEEGVYVVDAARRILYWNHGATRITGYAAHEATGSSCGSGVLMHCDGDGNVLCGTACPLLEVLADGMARERIVFLQHRDGHRVPVRARSGAVRGAGGAVVGALEMFEEALMPGRADNAALGAHGCLDELTGAANRAYGEMRLHQGLEAASRFGIPVGWLGIALDGAEELKHRYGHGLIDAAMTTIARTVDGNLGAHDVLMRWERTGFRVFLHNTPPEQMAELAARLVALVRASTLVWWGDPLRITVSIGAAPAGNGDSIENLEARAGQAFEHCRASGGNCAGWPREGGE